MTSKATLWQAAFAIALLLLVPAGCGHDPFELSEVLDISNQTDRYEFRVATPGTYSGTTRHHWTNTSAAAQLVIETPAGSGFASVTIQDADIGTVLTQSLLEAGTFETQPGRAGDWIITTILTNVTGRPEFTITAK